jgi:hypothetical protein
MRRKLELVGTPEVDSSGINKKNTRSREPKGKLVTTKENGFKTNMLMYIAAVKDVVIAGGIAFAWEDLAYLDPMQHYVVCVFAAVVATEAILFKLSKIQ